MAHLVIAGIGSRNTPLHVLRDMERIGEWCREHGVYVRSGHARGADYAFEKGARERCLVYLPTADFNAHLSLLGKVGYVAADDPRGRTAANNFHAGWGPSFVALARMRNTKIILGRDENRPVNLVVYWNPPMKTTGGTAHALAVARAQAPDAELVNMAKVTLLGTIERIDNALQRVLGSRS